MNGHEDVLLLCGRCVLPDRRGRSIAGGGGEGGGGATGAVGAGGGDGGGGDGEGGEGSGTSSVPLFRSRSTLSVSK